MDGVKLVKHTIGCLSGEDDRLNKSIEYSQAYSNKTRSDGLFSLLEITATLVSNEIPFHIFVFYNYNHKLYCRLCFVFSCTPYNVSLKIFASFAYQTTQFIETLQGEGQIAELN